MLNYRYSWLYSYYTFPSTREHVLEHQAESSNSKYTGLYYSFFMSEKMCFNIKNSPLIQSTQVCTIVIIPDYLLYVREHVLKNQAESSNSMYTDLYYN